MRDKIDKLIENIGKIIVGKEKAIQRIIICLLSKGHVLIEDVPGVGKTTLVKSLAKSIDLTFKRIQFTPDLLPSDITGVSIFNQKTNEFEFRVGPIYSNIVLADEINRTSPKTQSSLLECMEEFQLTVDGNTYSLPNPFMVLATQNPIEYEGTFPLPEAQMDRFMMKITIGYPDRYSEKSILKRFKNDNPLAFVKSVLSRSEIIKMQEEVENVYVDDSIEDYILDIINNTRDNPYVKLGVSPRGTLSLLKTAKGLAYINNRDYVIPDDIKELAISVLSHRLILKPEAKVEGIKEDAIIKDILDRIRVPVVKSYE
jgi:MoxR-like ATPase